MEEFSKNKKEKKLKCEENDDLVKRYDNKELEEKLNKKEKEEKNSIIMKLLEDSEYLSNEIIYKISEENFVEADSSKGAAKIEIPFKNLEANIILDCARTISDTEKAHVMYQVCH